MSDKPKSEWEKREIGALWRKKGNDQDFYSGKVTVDGKEVEIVCYTNKFKEKDSQPDLRIYISTSKKQ